MKRIIACLALAFCILIPSPVAAEAITSSDTAIVISKEGEAQFTENISYVFDGQKHGIFRDVPYVGQISEDQFLYYNFTLESVSRNGNLEQVKQSRQGVYENLKIGDPGKKISGEQTYTLVYRLSPVVRKDSAGDYITLNMHGTGWEVQANDVSGTITLPQGAQLVSRECFTGPQGSKKSDCIILVDPATNVLSVRATKPLAPQEGMTVDLVVQPGSFSDTAFVEISSTKPENSNRGFTPFLFGLFEYVTFLPFLIFGIIAAVFARRFMARKARREEETIVAQYEAPANLSPGQVGLMSDEVANSREITAMIIDLARRGHITISYEQKKQLLGSKDRFLLARNEAKDTLSISENLLLGGVFATAKSIYIDDLQPSSMYKVVESIRAQLIIDLQTAGLFAPKQKAFSPDNLTEKGYDVWAQVEGLKLYLNVAEKDRMKFAEAPSKTPERFTKLLPYAIALGVENEWARQFEGIDIEPATRNWYHGAHGSNSMLFVGLMSNSFASSVASHTSPPSSSGGAGGGFSGGGAGGGGGGSW